VRLRACGLLRPCDVHARGSLCKTRTIERQLTSKLGSARSDRFRRVTPEIAEPLRAQSLQFITVMRSKRPPMTCRADEQTTNLRKPRPHPHEQLPEEPPEAPPPSIDEPPNAKKPPKHPKHDEPMEPPDLEPPHVDPISR
jgi:hypothetical protein